jgi:hypothetical protein
LGYHLKLKGISIGHRVLRIDHRRNDLPKSDHRLHYCACCQRNDYCHRCFSYYLKIDCFLNSDTFPKAWRSPGNPYWWRQNFWNTGLN